jgi:hypothetical protein
MINIKCPECNGESSKIIAAGLPMKLCLECNLLWGFWSWFYAYLISPIEGMINGNFCFLTYEGSYLKALWEFIKNENNNN